MNKNYFLYELKKKSWISIFFIVCLAVGYVLAYGRVSEDLSNSFRNVYLSASIFYISTCIYAIFLFLSTLYQFSFFHTKQKVDIYLQMPITRKKMIVSNYFVVPILVTLPYILVNGIAIIHTFAMTQGIYDNSEIMFHNVYCIKLIVKMVISSLFIYSLMVYLATKTGKTIAHAFITVASVVAPCLIYIFTFAIAGQTINEGFDSSSYFTYIFTFFCYYGEMYTSVQIVYLIIQILGIIILPILTIKSFNKYKAENAERFLVSKRLYTFYLTLVPIAFAIFCELIIIAMTGKNDFVFLTLMFVSISLITYIITASIFNMSVNAKNFSVKNIIIIVVVGFIYSLIVFKDIFGLGGSAPNPNDIEKVLVNNYEVSMNDIDKILDLQTKAYITGGVHSDYNYVYSDDNIAEFTPEMKLDRLIFTYVLKDGRRINKMYYLPLDTVLYNDLEEIFTSDNYKQHYIELLNETRNNYLDCLVRVGNKELVINDRNGFYDALIKDIEADENFGYYTYSPLKFISINLMIKYDRHEYSYDILSDLKIGMDYKNTIDFIDSEYQKLYGEGLSILDSTLITVHKDLYETQKINKIKDQSIKYFPFSYYAYTTSVISNEIEDYDIEEYSYDKNQEVFIDFVNGDFYNSINRVMPISGDQVYKVTLGGFSQYELDLAYIIK